MCTKENDDANCVPTWLKSWSYKFELSEGDCSASQSPASPFCDAAAMNCKERLKKPDGGLACSSLGLVGKDVPPRLTDSLVRPCRKNSMPVLLSMCTLSNSLRLASMPLRNSCMPQSIGSLISWLFLSRCEVWYCLNQIRHSLAHGQQG